MKLLCEEVPTKVFEGEGGSYNAWTNSIIPALGDSKVGAGILTLQPRGFALPHYSDSSKIGFVIKGTSGVAGIIHPNSSENHEKIVKLTKGDTITVPSGSISWWFNAGNDNNDELQIIFLGETLHALRPGQFTYSFIAGTLSVIRGFSFNTIIKAYKLEDEQEVNNLINSQLGSLIIKLDDELARAMTTLPCISNNIDGDVKDLVNVQNGGSFTSFVAKDNVELSGNMLMLEPNAMFGPLYYAGKSGVQLGYVSKGSGRIEVVGMDGKLALDAKIEAGQLFVVPKFYVVAITAGEEGLECFSVVTTSEPMIGQLSGNKSIWGVMSSIVLQASLNVNSKFVEFLSANLDKTCSTIISPP